MTGGFMTALDEKEILILQILLDKINPQQMAHLRSLLGIDHKYVQALSVKLNFLPRGNQYEV
tara:strand:+ start:349 stop:534 length:186 start_codon:yes stop_codon:yes gene_type:complete